jgi:hypothetical protein
MLSNVSQNAVPLVTDILFSNTYEAMSELQQSSCMNFIESLFAK